MKSIINIVTSLRTNEGFTMQTKVKSALTKYLAGVLKLRTNEKCTNENRTNQGLGVFFKKNPDFFCPQNQCCDRCYCEQLIYNNILEIN